MRQTSLEIEKVHFKRASEDSSQTRDTLCTHHVIKLKYQLSFTSESNRAASILIPQPKTRLRVLLKEENLMVSFWEVGY